MATWNKEFGPTNWRGDESTRAKRKAWRDSVVGGIAVLSAVILVAWGLSTALDHKESGGGSYSLAVKWYENRPELRPMIKEAMEDGILRRGEWSDITDYEDSLERMHSKAELIRLIETIV